MADDKQASLTLLAKVDEATVQRSIKRLKELGAAERDVAAANKQAASSVLPLSAAQQKYIANLRQRVELGRKEIALSQQQARAINQEAAAREKAARAAGAQAAGSANKRLNALAGGASALGGLESLAGAGPGGDILRAVSSVARLQAQINQFSEASEGAAGVAGKATGGMSALGGSLAGLAAGGVAALAIAAISIAIQKFIEDLNRQQQALTTAVDAQQKYHELVLGASAEEIQAGIKNLEIKRQATAATLAEIEIGLKATDQMDGFSRAVADLLKVLGITTKDADRKREELNAIDAELNAYKKAARDRNISTSTLEQNTSALQATTQAEQKRNAALDEAKRKEEERTRAIKQAAQDIQQARMREAQAEASASQKRIEKMADIARQYAQSTADALRKLQEDQADLVTKFGQEQADAMLESQRDEEQAAREHSRSIKAIRDKSALDEFNAARDRDFARLVEIRRGVEQEVNEEAERFAVERQEANIALRQRLQDAAIAYQRERAARLTDYNNQLIELRITKQRQQAEARIAYNRELANLRQALQNEIALKQQALQAMLDQTRRWAGQMTSIVGRSGTGSITEASIGSGGRAGTARAFGGPLAAGQTALVNELGTERWMSAGRSMMLPGGAGLFTPFQSGTVQAAGGISVTQHVYAAPGMSEEKVAQIAAVRIRQTLKDLVA